MQPPPPSPSPRRRATTRALLRLLFLVALSLAALLAFVTSTPSSSFTPARRALQLVPPRRHRQPLTTLRAVRRDEDRPTSPVAPRAVGQGQHDSDLSDLDAVLLPDWEVLVLLRPDDDDSLPSGNATCAFPGGATSPARLLGRMPASGRQAYTCAMPRPERRHSRPFRAPRLVVATLLSSAVDEEDAAPAAAAARSLTPEMMRWSGRLVYDSAALDGEDGVLVFAKGVNPRQGVNRDAADIRCIYYRRSTAAIGNGDRDVVASLPATTSAQQVFRCPPPPSTATAASPAEAQQLRVTLAVAGEDPIPSVATYTPPPPQDAETAQTTASKKKLTCACTMVRDVAKFLREWVVYHAAVGVDRFYLYDNGSGDDLEGQVCQLSAEGFHVSTHAWPWPKTQEAGFSYAAAAHRDSCEWMAFVDVDEFIFSPDWAGSSEPTKSMLRSVVTTFEPDVGQVMLGCKDFGPSGHTKHPKEGVTQGYTCRRRAEERHKSLVRLDSIAPSLMNSVHHFELRPEFKWEQSRDARVNHYKYQAWDEFKVKFRHRVSTYVADWTDRVNHGSKDRTPGLGFEAIEPAGWPHKFCEVEDTLLRDVTRRWFGVGFTKKLAHRTVGRTTHSSS
ncbi:unnamed protein product [Miscanthus lutarioriparius]|uniref:Glycosyltransferase family 92 protein n=1 Tax=Miscanthus lutarioriparius TaxID=422564 RepID=A0A811SCA2_9POAL|nr:unnamed protein product [Miscanthus lutarioriparius]